MMAGRTIALSAGAYGLVIAGCFGGDGGGGAAAGVGGQGLAGAGGTGLGSAGAAGSPAAGASGQIVASGGASGGDGSAATDAATYCGSCGPDQGCGFPAPGAAHPECVSCETIPCAPIVCGRNETIGRVPGECCPTCISLGDGGTDCPAAAPYGCKPVSQGGVGGPLTPAPEVCGCVPDCGPLYLTVNAASGTWPNGDPKGMFICTDGPPS